MAQPTKTFAEQLKAWRARRGFTQERAARELGTSTRTLQNWEISRNTPSKPLLAFLIKLLR